MESAADPENIDEFIPIRREWEVSKEEKDREMRNFYFLENEEKKLIRYQIHLVNAFRKH